MARALPGVPHQLCQFHYLREAAKPIFEADRHAKKELKKRVRGVRPIERSLEGRTDAEAEAARGYCLAVRSALTDDGRPPLAASGLKLKDRLEAIADSLERVQHVQQRGEPEGRGAEQAARPAAARCCARVWQRPPRCGPPSRPATPSSTTPPICWPITSAGWGGAASGLPGPGPEPLAGAPHPGDPLALAAATFAKVSRELLARSLPLL